MSNGRRFAVVAAGVVAVSALWLTINAVAGGEVGGGDPPVAVMERDSSSPTLAGSGDGDAATSATGPTGEVWGVPVGYPHTVAGAEAAAVGWVSSLGALMRMGPIAQADTLHVLMTVDAATETIDEFAAERDRFIASFGADPLLGVWIDAPLQVDVVQADDGLAVVRVWSLLMLGTEQQEAQALWRTHTVTLRWERDDWRVDDVTRVEGPTPTVAPARLPSPPKDLSAVAGWTPAALAGLGPTG
jgi:hypothetical protein